MIDCIDRIKPTVLRDIKTEALLVFIRTTLEKFFQDIETNNIKFELGNKEENEYIESVLRVLFSNLKKYVVSSKYIRTLVSKSEKNIYLRQVLKKEESLIVYYDSLVRELENNLEQGTNWIPEQLVFCLLSEWVLEEEKSVYLYPFLFDIDYIDILSKYDSISLEDNIPTFTDTSVTVKNMYFLGTKLIAKLKASKYKINTTRKSKTRKTRK